MRIFISKRDQDIKECITNKEWTYRQYYENVLLTLALKEFFHQNYAQLQLSDIEPKLKEEDEEPAVTPDMALIIPNKNEGVLIEIKTTLTSHRLGAKKQIKKLEKYSQNFVNWETSDGQVINHSLWFIINASNSIEIKELIEEMLKNKELEINKPFMLIEHFKTTAREADEPTKTKIFFRKIYGQNKIPELESDLRKGFGIDEDTTVLGYENCKFLRTKPPVQYIMQVLFWDVLNVFYNIEEEEYEVSIDEVYNLINEYYNECGSEFSNLKLQIKRAWITEALEMFCNIGMGRKVETPTSSMKYKIKMVKAGQSSNFLSDIFKKICLYELRKGIFKRPKKGLESFLKKK